MMTETMKPFHFRHRLLAFKGQRNKCYNGLTGILDFHHARRAFAGSRSKCNSLQHSPAYLKPANVANILVSIFIQLHGHDIVVAVNSIRKHTSPTESL